MKLVTNIRKYNLVNITGNKQETKLFIDYIINNTSIIQNTVYFNYEYKKHHNYNNVHVIKTISDIIQYISNNIKNSVVVIDNYNLFVEERNNKFVCSILKRITEINNNTIILVDNYKTSNSNIFDLILESKITDNKVRIPQLIVSNIKDIFNFMESNYIFYVKYNKLVKTLNLIDMLIIQKDIFKNMITFNILKK